jgi:hypothetical protein
MRVLIVEDEKDMAQVLKVGLEEENHLVSLAFDGVSGLGVARACDFDVIVLDAMLVATTYRSYLRSGNLIAGRGCGSPVNPGNHVSYIKTQCFAVPNPITLRGNLGRNTLIGPGLMNFDFSLFKNNYIKRISDRFNVQFRAEFFNILNHANFAPPLDNRNIFDSTGSPVANAGLITSTQTPSRQIQFAVKLIW